MIVIMEVLVTIAIVTAVIMMNYRRNSIEKPDLSNKIRTEIFSIKRRKRYMEM